jgi:hypothetical protein
LLVSDGIAGEVHWFSTKRVIEVAPEIEGRDFRLKAAIEANARGGQYIFQFREQNGTTYRDYADLLGLAAVLSAKYRNQTFDFLGDDLIARLFRESVRNRAWDPAPDVKGSLKLPVLVR